jgi:hypothetical protein
MRFMHGTNANVEALWKIIEVQDLDPSCTEAKAPIPWTIILQCKAEESFLQCCSMGREGNCK